MSVKIEDSNRDADGFIKLIFKKPIPKSTHFAKQFNLLETKEIVFHHGYIAITNYKMGDNREFEKMLSVWDKVAYKYRLVGGYYVKAYREFRINRGFNITKLQEFFPNRPMRVENDAFKSDKINTKLFAGPRNDFQRVALTFMTSQGMYEKNGKFTQQLIDALPGEGKAQPDDTMIPTPKGLRRLDKLKVGDMVFNVFGEPVPILKIYPQKGEQETYELTFKDGRTARCNPEHLWYVLDKGSRDKSMKTMTLSQILEKYEKWSTDNDGTKHVYHRYAIPVPDAVQFKERKVPIDPYILGALIGNGCLSEKALTISSGNLDVPLELVKRLGYPTNVREYNNYSYKFIKSSRIDSKGKTRHAYIQTKKYLKDIPELIGSKSGTKFIPDAYKYNSVDVRMELLRGLLDTDGHIAKEKCQIFYTTTSPQLKDDLVELVRSLGFMAFVTKDGRDKYKSGYCYRIMITCPDDIKPTLFKVNQHSLKRARRGAAHYKTRRRNDVMTIISIKKLEPTKQRCIYIDDPLHVYVSENFIPTHNTYCGIATTVFWQRKAVIFVPFAKLLNQWKESVTEFTDIKASEVMIVQGGEACEKIRKGKCKNIKIFIFMVDTVASYQKRYGDIKTIEMLESTRAYLKIIDEVHRDMKSLSMIEALSNFKMNYYLSASPGRSESKENWIFNTLFKNVPKFGSSFKQQDEKHLNVMIKKYYWMPTSIQIKSMVSMRTGLNTKAFERELINSAPEQRRSFDDALRVMLTWSKRVVKPKNKIMLLAQSIDTLHYLKTIVDEIYPGEAAIYYGGMKPKDKEEALTHRIVIATDSSLGTGADIAGLQMVINVATYAAWISARQISGRLRKLKDGSPCIYCELVDAGYLKTMRQFEKRAPELRKQAKSGNLAIVN